MHTKSHRLLRGCYKDGEQKNRNRNRRLRKLYHYTNVSWGEICTVSKAKKTFKRLCYELIKRLTVETAIRAAKAERVLRWRNRDSDQRMQNGHKWVDTYKVSKAVLISMVMTSCSIISLSKGSRSSKNQSCQMKVLLCRAAEAKLKGSILLTKKDTLWYHTRRDHLFKISNKRSNLSRNKYMLKCKSKSTSTLKLAVLSSKFKISTFN